MNQWPLSSARSIDGVFAEGEKPHAVCLFDGFAEAGDQWKCLKAAV